MSGNVWMFSDEIDDEDLEFTNLLRFARSFLASFT